MTSPVGEPPLEALPPDAPATVEDVRASRRWTWVALAWAVAASAVGVIALVQNANESSRDTPTQTPTGVTTQQFDSFQKQVNDRLDAFSRRLNGTASQADVQKVDQSLTRLQDQLSKAQDTASKQNDAITQLQSDVKDLQKRVSTLESQQGAGGTGTGTGTSTTPTP